MRTVPLTTLTTQAWNQMVALLFRPIRWKVWLKLLLIAWLSGYLGQGGCNGGNFNIPTQPDTKKHEPAAVPPAREKTPGKTIKEKEVSKPYTYRDLRKDLRDAEEQAANYVVFILAAVAFFALFIALFAWLAARFSFVFVDVLTSGQVAIIEPFKRHREVAWTYFLWIFIFGIVVIGIMISFFVFAGLSMLQLYAATPNLPIENFFSEQFWKLFSILASYIIGLVVFFILMGIVGIWQADFVVAIMYQKRCNVLEAWQTYLRQVRAAPWDAVKYILWRWLIGIVVAVIYGIAMLAVMMVLFIVGLICFLIGAGVVALIPVLQWPLTAIGIMAIVVVTMALMFAMLLTMVPTAVWFRFFSLRYLQALNIGFHFFNDTPPLPPAALGKI